MTTDLVMAPAIVAERELSMNLLRSMSVANDGSRMPEHHAIMYAYNPSMTVLPPTDAAAVGAPYAVSFRVCNHNNCYRPITPKPLRSIRAILHCQNIPVTQLFKKSSF